MTKFKNTEELETEIEYLKKALELACERVKYFEEMQDREMGHFELFGYENEYDLQAIVKNYIDKAKLAEKEEQLLCKSWYKQYKNVMEANEGFYKECAKLREQLVEKDQDKIKFAVEQLRQAIKNIKKLNYKDFGIIYQSDAIAVIDNQIEELKKELE